jgi:hypothetical protein
VFTIEEEIYYIEEVEEATPIIGLADYNLAGVYYSDDEDDEDYIEEPY